MIDSRQLIDDVYAIIDRREDVARTPPVTPEEALAIASVVATASEGSKAEFHLLRELGLLHRGNGFTLVESCIASAVQLGYARRINDEKLERIAS